MTKTYTFYDEGYYCSNGCDCCEDVYMECYNSSDTDCNLGSAHSEEDCYVQAIVTESDAYKEDEGLWEMDLDALKQIAKELCIEVEIIS